MPAEYLIVVERSLVLTRGHGVITNDDVIMHARNLKAEPGFAPDFRQFADFSGVEVSPLTTDVVHAITGSLNPFAPDAVRAFYAPDDISFAICRMFEMLHADRHMLVTRSREEAEGHVGMEPGESVRLWKLMTTSPRKLAARPPSPE